MIKDAWTVSELLRHVCDEADLVGDLGLGFYAAGLEFTALQFAQVTGEQLTFPDLSAEDAIREAWRIVSAWSTDQPGVAEFLIHLDDLRTGRFRKGALR